MRAEGDLKGRVAELAKEHPSVPRHANNSDEYVSPTEIGKVRNEIVKAAWTAPQLFNNRFLDGQHGVDLQLE